MVVWASQNMIYFETFSVGRDLGWFPNLKVRIKTLLRNDEAFGATVYRATGSLNKWQMRSARLSVVHGKIGRR